MIDKKVNFIVAHIVRVNYYDVIVSPDNLIQEALVPEDITQPNLEVIDFVVIDVKAEGAC